MRKLAAARRRRMKKKKGSDYSSVGKHSSEKKQNSKYLTQIRSIFHQFYQCSVRLKAAQCASILQTQYSFSDQEKKEQVIFRCCSDVKMSWASLKGAYFMRLLHKLVGAFFAPLWVKNIPGQVTSQKNMGRVLRFWKLANLPPLLSTRMQEKVVMQRSALLVVECSNTAIVVNEVAVGIIAQRWRKRSNGWKRRVCRPMWKKKTKGACSSFYTPPPHAPEMIFVTSISSSAYVKLLPLR